MDAKIKLSGPRRYRIRSMATAVSSAGKVTVRRKLHGPRLPGWNWFVEFSTAVMHSQLAHAFSLQGVRDARRYLDSLAVVSPAVRKVERIPVHENSIRGDWFVCHGQSPQTTLLYFHGGGYSFYPRSYVSLIAELTLAARSRTFALDYCLAPENRFPAQLEDALSAYRWLLDRDTNPTQLVVAGDSAGGHLTLTLLLALRDAKLPMPALAIALSPATEFEDHNRHSVTANERYDYLRKSMLMKWAAWFCNADEATNPLVSPIYADLRNLPPIYIQAGRAEILYDCITAFADHAATQQADVVLETWDNMVHVFQMFGQEAPQSTDALRRIAQVIEHRQNSAAL